MYLKVPDYKCQLTHTNPTFYYDPEKGLYCHPLPGYLSHTQLRVIEIGTPPLDQNLFNPANGLYYYTSEKPYGDLYKPDFIEYELPHGKKKPPAFEYYVTHDTAIKDEDQEKSVKIKAATSSEYLLKAHQPPRQPDVLIPKLNSYPYFYDPDKGLFYNVKDNLYYDKMPKSETPIYFDAGWYFYPRSIVASTLKETVPVVKGKPQFYQDPKVGLYFDSVTHEQYFRVADVNELDDLEVAVKGQDPPLYYDPELQIYFYPFKSLQVNISWLERFFK